jgi:hypothetical protein
MNLFLIASVFAASAVEVVEVVTIVVGVGSTRGWRDTLVGARGPAHRLDRGALRRSLRAAQTRDVPIRATADYAAFAGRDPAMESDEEGRPFTRSRC